jgi:cytoskeletal protein RodZ
MDFGQYLRQARERRGITLRQIAVTTRISHRILEALENNEIGRLPGGIFSRAFVRSYAQEVGLDPDDTVQRFLQQFPVDDVTAGSPLVASFDPQLEDEQTRQRQVAGVLIALAIGIPIVALIVYFAFSSRQPAAAAGDGPDGASTPSAETSAPASTPSASTGAATAGTRPGTSAAVAPAAARTGSPAPVVDGIHLTLNATGPCWIRITSDGVVQYQGLLPRGARQETLARDRVYLEIGDAGMLTLTLNDRPARALGRPGQVVRTEIRRANLAQWLAPAP